MNAPAAFRRGACPGHKCRRQGGAGDVVAAPLDVTANTID